MDFTRAFWPASLLIGVKAALDSGAQRGITGETAYSDLLLAFTKGRQSLQQSGDNVFIGVDNAWSHMILQTLRARHLSFCCLLWKENDQAVTGSASYLSCQASGCARVKKPDGIKVLPNMFYGLVDAAPLTNDLASETTLHRPECILRLPIQERSTEFLTVHLHDRLSNRSANDGLDFCFKLIDNATTKLMKLPTANYWDKRIMVRIQKLFETMSKESPLLESTVGRSSFLQNKDIEQWIQEDMDGNELDMNDTIRNEVIDRIFSRVQDMFERLGVNEFIPEDGEASLMGDQKAVYTANDVFRAFIFCFGTMRAVIMSEHIFRDKGLILMGYNISVGREIVSDLSQMPTKDQVGYAPRLQVSSERLLDTVISDDHVFFGLALDVVLSTTIASLTGLGPTLSMYVSHLLTSRYRESTLRMGTSMSWAVGRVRLLNTGTARDDWMACILPARRPNATRIFQTLAAAGVFCPVAAWLYWQHPVGPLDNLGKRIVNYSVLSGLAWLCAIYSMNKDKHFSPMMMIGYSISFIPLLILLICNISQWRFIGLEVLYAALYLYGERNGIWAYRGSSLFALGIVGALRLNSAVLR
ncbi:hypothetical protein BX666DRAFT_2000327 [Dichotomocladium elegans]|nr:hypothetical protein BX666DRAFT_2000327 [Dichotomocladium elegans]